MSEKVKKPRMYTPLTGEQLMRLRMDALLTRKEVEKMTGVRSGGIAKYESGERAIPFTTLRKLIAILGPQAERHRKVFAEGKRLVGIAKKRRQKVIDNVLNRIDIKMTLGDWQAFWRWRNAGEYDRMMANREHTIKVVKETYFKINPIGTESYKVKRPFPRTSRIGMKVGTLGVSEQFAAQKEKEKS